MKTKSALRLIKTLPPLPTAVARLAELAQTATPDIDDVVKVVRHDPAVAAAVLRIANSAASAPSRGVTNIYRAVVQVGTKAAIEAAMSAAFTGILPKKLPGYEVSRDDFAEHCVAVGKMTATVVRAAHIDLIGDPFIAGLLHDCGKLVLCRVVGKEKAAMRRSVSEGARWVEAEQEQLGTDHTALGGMLATAWKLPALIVSAARFHHAPEQAPSEVEKSLSAAIHLADALVHQAAGTACEAGPEALSLLSLDTEAVHELRERATALSSAA